MIAIYAVAIVLGILGILIWIAMGLAASSMHNMAHLEPEERFGDRGRYGIATIMGFGMAGMSASFGGWNDGLAVVAAVAGAAAGVASVRYLGVDDEEEQESA